MSYNIENEYMLILESLKSKIRTAKPHLKDHMLQSYRVTEGRITCQQSSILQQAVAKLHWTIFVLLPKAIAFDVIPDIREMLTQAHPKTYALRREFTWFHFSLALPTEAERVDEINRERRWLKEQVEQVDTGKIEGGGV